MPSGPIRNLTEAEISHADYASHLLISRNGHNTIYRAEKDGRWFILKGLRDDRTGDRERDMYLLHREYELMKSLQSPYVVQVWEMTNDSIAGPCIVMEYVEGQMLDEWLSSSPRRRDRKQVLDELLEAVSYLHSRQIIHGDIKPSNLLISNNGNHVKLIDLGLSDRDDFIAKGLGSSPGFAAPEQKDAGSVIDCRTDIYAIGTLIKMLFPHRYAWVVRNCHRPQHHRYSSVARLQSALRRTDLLPRIGMASAEACILIVLLYSRAGTTNQQTTDHVLDSILARQHALYEAHTDSIWNLIQQQQPAPESEEYNQLLLDWGMRFCDLNEQSKKAHPAYGAELDEDYFSQWYKQRIRLLPKE